MIKYKKLSWGNCFSYGDNNTIIFDSNPITQLIGKNGNGKSSIALILEEVLFNKNSKGIKKGNILNRNVSDKSYRIFLEFEKDGDLYEIKTSRGSTQKVYLYKNGVDISDHTATGTFKEIEKLIGYDHSTFCQIVYQASAQSLQFLTATDTQRKKFLIELLNLNRYTNALDIFKQELSDIKTAVAVTESKINSAELHISSLSKEDLSIKSLLEQPSAPDAQREELQSTLILLANISEENKKRVKNNKYKELRDSIILPPAPTKQISDTELNRLRDNVSNLNGKLSSAKSTLKKLQSVKTNCPTCGQSLKTDSSLSSSITENSVLIDSLNTELKEANIIFNEALELNKAMKVYNEKLLELEKYQSNINDSIESVLLDEGVLISKKKQLESVIYDIEADIKRVQDHNIKVEKHNSRVDILTQQLTEFKSDLTKYREELQSIVKKRSNLEILVKAFSTTGLVAYKIEGLVKDLENIVNEYLLEMSDGRFQLSFQISSSDKLNVVITDNGKDVDINALSSGERARVNVSTLFAIRKLMQTLSSTKTNLLILDETIENLDTDGKEKLIEVLLSEEDLNTFIISHGFTHPLLEKLHIVKENDISRIE